MADNNVFHVVTEILFDKCHTGVLNNIIGSVHGEISGDYRLMAQY